MLFSSNTFLFGFLPAVVVLFTYAPGAVGMYCCWYPA